MEKLFPGFVVAALTVLLVSCQKKETETPAETAAPEEPAVVTNEITTSYDNLAPNQCLATVGDEFLTKQMVDDKVDMDLALYCRKIPSPEKQEKARKNRPNLCRKTIPQLFSRMLLVNAARAANVTVDAADREAAKRRYALTYGRRKETAEQFWADLGPHAEMLGAQLEGELLTEAYLKSAYSNELAVTEADVTALGEHYLQMSRNGEATNVLVRAQAAEIRAKAVGGEDFAALARRYSEDDTFREEGGNMGACTSNDFTLEPDLWITLAGLKEGETSDVIETEYGFYIFRRDTPPPDEEVLPGEIYLSQIYFMKAQTFPEYSRKELREMEEKTRHDAVIKKALDALKEESAARMVPMKVLFPPKNAKRAPKQKAQ